MLRKEITPDQVMQAVAERTLTVEPQVVGIPGFVQAALVAPDCVMICDERVPYMPIIFCLN